MFHVSDRIKRAVAFYCSIALFFILLPIILSYSLGYLIDYKDFKIYKTGILYLKSRPSGAAIVLNGRPLADITPAQIEELKPGTYTVEVRREGFYPWQKSLTVRPNMVTKADDIILFPLTQDLSRIGRGDTMDFFISDKNILYQMTRDGLYRSNIDGSASKKIASYTGWPQKISGKRSSPDGNKFLFFTERRIWVAYLNPEDAMPAPVSPARVELLTESSERIIDAFWYSGSKHIVFVTDREVNAVEIYGKGERNTVTLFTFFAVPHAISYDEGNDSLYFVDRNQDGASYLYRLGLREKFFDKLIQRLTKGWEAGNGKE